VRQLTWVSNVLVSRAGGPIVSMQDVVAAGRPAPLTFASGGNGTPAHLAAALFAREARIQVQHIPFNGAMAGVNAVLAGHVQLMFATGPAVAGLVQSGKLQPIAVAAPERLAATPSTPTLAESGFAAATMRDWHGLVAPAGTPAERIERIAAALDKVLAADAVRQRLAAAGLEPVAQSSPAAFGKLVASETARWGDLVRSAGVRLE
jgi:tripartite-type tricarboxylate transporter receptor subunit TctC